MVGWRTKEINQWKKTKLTVLCEYETENQKYEAKILTYMLWWTLASALIELNECDLRMMEEERLAQPLTQQADGGQ